MNPTEPLLILDADGVFLSERGYWEAALSVALRAGGLEDRVGEDRVALGDAAFGAAGLQRVTKRRGCNSNWDLAAVLVAAVESEGVPRELARRLDAGRIVEAMQYLERAADSLWRGTRATDDPLEGFGVERGGAAFSDVVESFQHALDGAPAVPAEGLGAIAAAFRRTRERGYALRVCTGRPRAEIEAPLAQLGFEVFLPPAALTCADEAARAARVTGRVHLGKPHWFAPACATLGFDAAIEMLRGEGHGSLDHPVVYLGDAWADYLSVAGCRAQGLDLAYLHKRSGATTREQECSIAGADFGLGVVDRLAQVPDLLPGVAA